MNKGEEKMGKKVFKKLFAPFMVVLSILLIGTTAVSAAEWKDYDDVSKDNAHYEAIKELTVQGVFKGNEFDEFEPWAHLTRQQMAVVLSKVTDFETPENVAKTLEAYSDINSESRYAEEIATLTKAGVFKGDENGNFNPYDHITRQQMASVLVLAMDLEKINDKKVDEDVEVILDNVSNSHKERVQILANLGVTNQLDDFRAYENISRAAVATFVYQAQSAGNFSLSVMHMNDTHARADELTKMVTAVKEVREEKPDSLLLHGGDVFSGTLYFTEHKGQADLAMFNMMGLDAMVFGNHEFDLGDKEGGHESLAKFVNNAEFPLLGTNIDFSGDPFMQFFATNESLVKDPKPGKSYHSIIKEVDGEEVGIFGLTTEDTVDISSPVNVTFSNFIETAEEAVAEFEEAGVDKIIAVTHLGYDSDPSVGNDLLLGQVEGIDVIVGGHSHTELPEPSVVDENAEGNEKNPTVIVQAGQYADNLGTLDVEFDEDGVVVGYAGELLDLSEYDADEDAVKELEEYTEAVEELENEEIGAVAEKPLTNPRQDEPGDDSVRANETELGNLITDAMLAKAKEKYPDTVIAFQNGGGIREAIDEGPITVGEVISVLPFGNDPVIADLTGSEIKEILEHSVRSAPAENGGFLHVSGMKFTYDSNKDQGERVQEMYVKEDDEYVEIELDKEYRVTTNNFTGQGGDGFETFAKAYEDGRVKDIGESDWEQLRDYMVEDLDGKVNPEREGRIVDIANQEDDSNGDDDSGEEGQGEN